MKTQLVWSFIICIFFNTNESQVKLTKFEQICLSWKYGVQTTVWIVKWKSILFYGGFSKHCLKHESICTKSTWSPHGHRNSLQKVVPSKEAFKQNLYGCMNLLLNLLLSKVYDPPKMTCVVHGLTRIRQLFYIKSSYWFFYVYFFEKIAKAFQITGRSIVIIHNIVLFQTIEFTPLDWHIQCIPKSLHISTECDHGYRSIAP
jgi:hypothetical protein